MDRGFQRLLQGDPHVVVHDHVSQDAAAPCCGTRKLTTRGRFDKSLFVSDCFIKNAVESTCYDQLTIRFAAVQQRR
jgi:hypothetical protein